MAKVGDAYVEVKPDTDKFGTWLKAQMSGISGDADKGGKNVGLRFGNAMQTGIASAMGRTGLLVGLGAVMAGPLSAATSGLTAGLTALGASAAYAGGSAAAALPIFTALAQGIGVTKIGTIGMEDAFKEAFKATAQLAAGEKLTEAEQAKLTASMKNLAPAARAVVGETLKLYPAFQKLRLGVQQRLFVGLAGVMKTTATRFLPLMTQQLNISATTLNRLVKSFARVNTTAHAMNSWGKILNANNVILRSLGASALQAFSGAREAMVPLLPFGIRLAAAINRVATAFNKWATSAKGQNQITNFMRAAFVSAKLLLSISKNLAIALGNIFKQGKGTGDSLLVLINNLTARFAAWTGSLKGQSALQRWFAEGKQTMIEVGGLLGDIAKAFGGLAGTADPSDTVAQLRQALQPVLQLLQQINATGVGQQVIQGFTQIAAALQQMNAGGAISAFISSLVSMTQTVANLVTAIPGGTQTIASLATVLGTLAAIRFVGTVTGISSVVGALGKMSAAGIKSQGGVVGTFDTIRLKAMYMADSMRGVGARMASGLSTAWTAIGVGAINTQTKLSAFGTKVASIGSRLGTAFASGAASAGSALGRMASGLAGMVASGARVVAMNARVAASIALMGVQSALAAAKTVVIRAATAAWAAVQWVLNAALTANPIGLVVAGLALLAAGIYLAWTRSATFRTIVIAVFNAIKGVVLSSLNVVRSVITAVWGWAGPFISKVVSVIGTVIRTYFMIYATIIRTALAVVRAVVSAVFNFVRSFITSSVNAVRSVVTSVWGAIRSAVTSAASAVRSAVTSAFNAVRSVASSAFNAAKSAVSSAMTGIKNAVVNGVQAVGQTMGRIKSAVTGAVSGAASWLVSAGGDLIRGLISGIANMASAVASKAKEVVSGAVNAAKSALHIGSPSRVFMVIGRQTIQGFVLGIDDSAASARKATENLMSKIIDAAAKAYGTKGLTAAQKKAILAQRNSLTAYVQRVYNKIVAPTAKKIDQLAASITRTTASIQAMQKARAELAGNIAQANLGGRDLFGELMNGVAPDPAAVVKRLQDNLKALTAFRAKLAALVKKGLTNEVVQQIASQGAAAGTQMADTLLKATPKQIGALNATYKAIGTQATAVGNTVAGGMYDAGIAAAQGLLKGLQSQRQKLVTYLAQVANTMVATLRKTLKIKSPSRVFQDIGMNTGAGLALGLTQSQSLVDKAQLQLGTGLLGTATTLPKDFGPQLSIGQLRVFIGDKEITEIARTEVKAANTKIQDKTLRRTTV